MLITIEINDDYIETLSQPISLRNILNIAIDCANGNTDPNLIECVNEKLYPMIPALSHLHYQVKNHLINRK